MQTQEEHQTIATLVPDRKRAALVGRLFGSHFPMYIEPAMFNTLDRQVEDYNGGFWSFYELDNGGFYAAPAKDDKAVMHSDNQYSANISYDAAGIVACLFAFSHLSFSPNIPLAKNCSKHYHLLREYIFDHPEVSDILSLID